VEASNVPSALIVPILAALRNAEQEDPREQAAGTPEQEMLTSMTTPNPFDHRCWLTTLLLAALAVYFVASGPGRAQPADPAEQSSPSAAPDLPRPEHPNPQAVRSEWLNLNGRWEFAETNDDETERYLSGRPYPETIVVPFCREAPLSGIHRREFVKNVWYRRTFDLPQGWKSPRVRFHIGACDWRTTVWVNKKIQGTHTGGNAPVSFDITDALQKKGNQVVIHAFDDTPSGLQPLGKQSNRSESWGIFYTPTTGIWQTVWLEGVGSTFIREFRVEPDPEKKQAAVCVVLDGPTEGLTLRVDAFAEGNPSGSVQMPAIWRDNRLLINLDTKRLWSPSDPFLYDLSLTVKHGDKTVDQVNSYFGLRRVRIEGAAILINDQPVFQRLILDQGFYPDGVWTAPTDDALRGDIELSMACGFNGARLHQKVFEPRFLYWADKLGYLVWGEFPSYGANYADARVNMPIIREWGEIVARDRNHPSIIGWCPFNETPGDAGPLQNAVVNLTRELDPSRPVIDTSGWTHSLPDPEVMDAHDYDQNPDTFRKRWAASVQGLPERYGFKRRNRLPFMLSEFGGIGFNLDAHSWGYGNAPETKEDFYTRFKGLVDAQLDNPNHFGFCYTQLTDVEQEHNGLYSFDRKPKFDPRTLHTIVSRKAIYEKDPPLTFAEAPPMDWTLLIGSFYDEHLSWSWRYTTEQPPENWNQPGFDDSKWAAGRPPYGRKEGKWQAMIRTPWTTSDIWLRQDCAYDGKPFDKAFVVIHYDNDTKIFLGGQPVWSGTGWNDRYDAFDVTDTVRSALKPGLNPVAAHVHQDAGGQYFDIALLIGAIRKE